MELLILAKYITLGFALALIVGWAVGAADYYCDIEPSDWTIRLMKIGLVGVLVGMPTIIYLQ